VPSAAHAGPITVFDLTNATIETPYGSLGLESGTVTINTVTGAIVSENIEIKDVWIPDLGHVLINYHFAGPISSVNQGSDPYSSTPEYYSEISGTATPTSAGVDNAGTSFYLTLPVSSLVGYTGGPLCTISLIPCGGDYTTLYTGESDENFYFELGGDLTPDTPVPEPSTLLLLATGMVGVAGTARRRILSRRNS